MTPLNNGDDFGGATPLSLPTLGSVTSGYSLYLIFRTQFVANTVTVTDDGGAAPTYSLVRERLADGDADPKDLRIFVRNSVTDDPNNILLTLSQDSGVRWAIFECPPGYELDAGNDAASGTAGTSISTDVTTSVASCRGLGLVSVGASVDATTTGDFSSEYPGGSSAAHWLYSSDLGAAGVKACGASWTGAQENSVIAVALRPTGGGAILIPRPLKQRFFLRGVRR